MPTRLDVRRFPVPAAVAAFVLLLTVALLAGEAISVTAAFPTAITIHESVVFGTDHQRPVGTFAALGAPAPACGSGTFTDRLSQFNPAGHTLVVDRTYMCESGSATFRARMDLHLELVDEDGNQTVSGEWTILEATGAMSGVHGTGVTHGVSSGCSPIGAQLPMCQSGVSTVTASIA